MPVVGGGGDVVIAWDATGQRFRGGGLEYDWTYSAAVRSGQANNSFLLLRTSIRCIQGLIQERIKTGIFPVIYFKQN